MKGPATIIFTVYCITFSIALLSAQDQLSDKNTRIDQRPGTPEEVVTEIYQLVTFEAGQLPDWEKVRALFIEDAVVILRTSRTEHSIFSTEEFIDDFQNFIERSRVDTTGFTEDVVNVQTTTFGDIAHCIVIYEASITGNDRPPQKGVDSFQLIKRNDQWKIVSIVNEIPMGERKIPKELFKQ